MVKKRGNCASSPFKVGKLGGCEALLYEFRERFPPTYRRSDPEESSGPRQPHSMRIAAATFDEALFYLRRREPDFAVHSTVCLGLITVVSGSPVD